MPEQRHRDGAGHSGKPEKPHASSSDWESPPHAHNIAT
jgi:hypothetical protein